MRRALGVVMATFLVGLMIGGLGTTSAAQTQIRVFENPETYSRFVDLGKAGLSPGDVRVQVSTLLDPDDESVVGKAIVEATIVRVHRDESLTFILEATVQLAEGEIVFYGGLRNSELTSEPGRTLSVTGGTGSFAGANGTVTIVAAELAGQQGFMWTFQLVAP